MVCVRLCEDRSKDRFTDTVRLDWSIPFEMPSVALVDYAKPINQPSATLHPWLVLLGSACEPIARSKVGEL